MIDVAAWLMVIFYILLAAAMIAIIAAVFILPVMFIIKGVHQARQKREGEADNTD